MACRGFVGPRRGVDDWDKSASFDGSATWRRSTLSLAVIRASAVYSADQLPEAPLWPEQYPRSNRRFAPFQMRKRSACCEPFLRNWMAPQMLAPNRLGSKKFSAEVANWTPAWLRRCPPIRYSLTSGGSSRNDEVELSFRGPGRNGRRWVLSGRSSTWSLGRGLGR